MGYENGKATMIELDMIHALYFGDFLRNGRRESFLHNQLFGVDPPRKAAWLPRK
jgi:hypothetical protein